jgi:membrane-bound serine protease (ClpP class)
MKRILIVFIAFLLHSTIFANESDTLLIYKFNIKEQIAPSIWRQTKKAFENADTMNADLILIHMNTYGGTVVDADSIRTRIINNSIPVWVFIDNNAASAGALISIACDSIYMRPGANIGAATVVNQSGQKAPDKYQSYFRSTMRSTAQSHGADTIYTDTDTIIKWFRNPIMAEAMVDEDVYIPGIIDTGKILTFTANEALTNGFCEAIVNNVSELLEKANIKHYEIREYTPTTIDKIVGLLTNPIVSGLLIMAILGGIYFEMQTPGIGFPLVIAIIAAIGYFAPLYLEGLAENWEIIIFVVGLILIALEIFVVPGFGITGALGITFTITGLTLSLLDNVNFNFENVEGTAIITALLTVTVSILAGFILSIWLSQKLFTANHGPLSRLALKTTQNLTDGYVGTDIRLAEMIGKTGIAQTVLRPSGRILIDTEIWDAKSEDGFIEKGEKIKVIKQETAQLYVERNKE